MPTPTRIEFEGGCGDGFRHEYPDDFGDPPAPGATFDVLDDESGIKVDFYRFAGFRYDAEGTAAVYVVV